MFGAEYSQNVANEDGTFSLKYPPTTITLNISVTTKNNIVIATELANFNKNDYYTKTEIDEKIKEQEESEEFE